MSDTPKHTPGPWVWQSFDGGRTIFLGTPDRGRLVVLDAGGMPSGPNRYHQTVNLRFATGRNGQAIGGVMRPATAELCANHPDALLIAAAPDLYAALKSLEWSGTTRWESTCPCCHKFKGTTHDPACSLAAALAKAEGEAA